VLLALDHIGKARVVPEHPEVEFHDELAFDPIPDTEFRLGEPAARDLIVETEIGEDFELAACVVAARGLSFTRASASSTCIGMFCRASASARITPTGPPPAIRIGRSECTLVILPSGLLEPIAILPGAKPLEQNTGTTEDYRGPAERGKLRFRSP
jgi:hypothetical protein